MSVESQGFGKFSSICVLLKIMSKRGHVKIFNSLERALNDLSQFSLFACFLKPDLNPVSECFFCNLSPRERGLRMVHLICTV